MFTPMQITNRKIFIYSQLKTARFTYVLEWVFREQLHLDFEIVNDIAEWRRIEGLKLSYSDEILEPGTVNIKPHSLLAEEGVKAQTYSINRWKQSTILFYNQPGALVPFDIFSAVFFLISRYEEYLPHTKDKHGRFDHKQSVAAQFSFSQEPVIDEWLFHFRSALEQTFNCTLPKRAFTFLPTYDIDIAWKYLHKGKKRNLGGFAKDFLRFKWKAIVERKAVLAGKKTDPFDSFYWLEALHDRYGLQPIYFLLLGSWGKYDKNADPSLPAMQHLLQRLSKKNDVGIHPSYQSHDGLETLKKEIAVLSKASEKTVSKNRQHYIKFSLPETYRALIEAQITDDYSMGYASCNGFRAGTSNSFLWYDLLNEKATALRVHPFAFMEATNMFYQLDNVQEAFQEWERLYLAVRNVGGTFISIWHNHTLGTDRTTKGWRELYEKTIATIAQINRG